jgi:hypothetical protein
LVRQVEHCLLAYFICFVISTLYAYGIVISCIHISVNYHIRTGANSGTGTANPAGAHEFIHGSYYLIISFMCMFCISCLSFCPFFVGHCAICPSSILISPLTSSYRLYLEMLAEKTNDKCCSLHFNYVFVPIIVRRTTVKTHFKLSDAAQF